MILETITDINATLAARLQMPSVLHGLCSAMYSQQDKGPTLIVRTIVQDPEGKDVVQTERLVIDDQYGWQSAHVMGRTQLNRAATKTYGSITDNRYEVSMTLIIASKLPNLTDFVWQSFARSMRLRIEGIDTDTLDVLRRNWLVTTDQAKNYDPALSAVAVRYSILDVGQDELTGLIDQL